MRSRLREQARSQERRVRNLARTFMNSAPKKRFGQHFLQAAYYAEKIAASVPASGSETVIEIGAGAGALSVHLQRRFSGLQVIEKDRDLISDLSERLGEGAWRVHQADALTFDFASMGERLHIAGNLPYNAGALIIKRVLLQSPRVISVTFMVQREVAERIAAVPGSGRMGFLSIFCRFFGDPAILFTVPPGAFFPKPKVDSAVFQINPVRNPEAIIPRDQWNHFFALVDKGFSQRRKMIVNTLGKDKERVRKILIAAGIDAAARPEMLDCNDWIRLYRAFETAGIYA